VKIATKAILAILTGATCAWCLGPAAAATGACGLETGTWADRVEACQFADRQEEAVRRFGEDALLGWYSGYYRFQGAHCTIFSDKRTGKRCSLYIECDYEGTHAMGPLEIEIESAQRLRFGTQSTSTVYSRCPGRPAP
jgi:hypothetical protein